MTAIGQTTSSLPSQRTPVGSFDGFVAGGQQASVLVGASVVAASVPAMVGRRQGLRSVYPPGTTLAMVAGSMGLVFAGGVHGALRYRDTGYANSGGAPSRAVVFTSVGGALAGAGVACGYYALRGGLPSFNRAAMSAVGGAILATVATDVALGAPVKSAAVRSSPVYTAPEPVPTVPGTDIPDTNVPATPAPSPSVPGAETGDGKGANPVLVVGAGSAVVGGVWSARALGKGGGNFNPKVVMGCAALAGLAGALAASSLVNKAKQDDNSGHNPNK